MIVGMAPVFSDIIVGQFPGSDKYFLYFHCHGSNYSDSTMGYGSFFLKNVLFFTFFYLKFKE